MKIEPFRTEDMAPFLKLAAEEGWITEPWELEFQLTEFSKGCFTARADSGEPAGFVTSLRHSRSGWIGNLIVGKAFRGQGIAEQLFTSAFRALQSAGVETAWLTASKSGQSLYEKHGFRRIDTINRWVGTGQQRPVRHDHQSDLNSSISSVSSIDFQAWGDRRDGLLAATVSRGLLFLEECGSAVIQPCGDDHQIGPFSALNGGTAEKVFGMALRSIPSGSNFYLDSPLSNRDATRMFKRNRMNISGSNELMYAGVKPAYMPEYIYSLATMGSCG